ncbi:MAG: hypothetical protein LQ340_001655 [Diploschistes diacapsis]|nr:MAG: hypothetical protein LQ340_001655 [Diploschistes diacapsis]
MSLDLALVSEAELLFPLHNAMQACLGDESASISQPQMLASLEAIYRKVDSVQLQLQLTKTIPVATITCCTLRRRLALAFFFKDISYLTKDAPLLPELPQMAKFLRVQPAYTIKHSMDFHQLGTSMSLLDIGIDDGDRPSDPLDAAVERKFNKGVDELLEAIKYMSSRIVDSGASHMSRTEAKEVLVAMDSRLHYAVRTKPRPKKSVFGDVERSGSSNFMRKFAIQSETAGNV